MGSSTHDVSEQVLFDILLYLPVISLLRFKTICKFWCFLIESSTFITQHLHHNSDQNNLIVLTYDNQLYMLSGSKHEERSKLNFDCIYPDGFLEINNSCNGIVCVIQRVGREYWRISLFNPAIKQARELPESSFLSLWDSNPGLVYPLRGVSTALVHMFALGFDTKTNDYKIVSISLEFSGSRKLHGSLLQVYSMRTDSWRTIHEGDDFPIASYDYQMGATCKGKMCLWIGELNGCGTHVIFYFDLTDEVYGTVPLPDDRFATYFQSPAFLDDKIAYIQWHDNGSDCGGRSETSYCSYYDIWMMNEFGMKESWNKVYRVEEFFSPHGGPCRPILSKNGDFILKGRDAKIYLYDLVTGEEKSLDVPNPNNITGYNESLVSVRSTSRTS